MLPIIQAIAKSDLKRELNSRTFVRPTNNGNNEIYIVNGIECPNVMLELGRLRELSFRQAGGGSGKDADVDEFDLGKYPYKQLLVWNPKHEEIIGGYRFIKISDALDENGEYHLSTSEIIQYTEKIKKEYFPHSIELGRSFVQPQYQPSAENRKGLFSLDNLWDGLGAITVLYPNIKYFFGKVTMYNSFNPLARDYILSFMDHYFPDPEGLLILPHPLVREYNLEDFIKSLQGLDYKEGHHILNKIVRELGENIPPLFNSYMNLSPTMKTFGTSVNPHFGGVQETGIMVTIDDIYPSKKQRHVQSYLDWKEGLIPTETEL